MKCSLTSTISLKEQIKLIIWITTLYYNQSFYLKELLDALKGIPNNEFPSNDGLAKEFYEIFWMK